MSTATYYEKLHDRPFLRRAVMECSSLSALAKTIGVDYRVLVAALRQHEIAPPPANYYHRRRALFEQGKRVAARQELYHARNKEGRRRQALIRQIVRGRQNEKTLPAIASELNITPRLCDVLSKTPYAEALLWAWGEVHLSWQQQYVLACRMVDFGFDGKVITKTLEIDATVYARKMGVEI